MFNDKYIFMFTGKVVCEAFVTNSSEFRFGISSTENVWSRVQYQGRTGELHSYCSAYMQHSDWSEALLKIIWQTRTSTITEGPYVRVSASWISWTNAQFWNICLYRVLWPWNSGYGSFMSLEVTLCLEVVQCSAACCAMKAATHDQNLILSGTFNQCS